MRVVSLLASTLIVATASFAQQSSAPGGTAAGASPSKTSVASVDQLSAVAEDHPPEHPCTVAQVHELLELTGAKQLQLQVQTKMMAQLQKVFPPFMPKDVIEEIATSLEKIDTEPMAVKAYQRHISTEDAAQLIAFYKTPTGQRVLHVLPLVVAELQDAGSKEGERVAQDVIQRHMDEIKAAAVKYQQDHAAPPTVITPN